MAPELPKFTPPPNNTFGDKLWPIVAGVLFFGALFTVIGLMVAGSQNITSEPSVAERAPMRNFGLPPVLKPRGDGWNTYRFGELGFDIDLPSKVSTPNSVPTEEEQEVASARGNFEAESDFVTVSIEVYQTRESPADIRLRASAFPRTMKDEGAKSVKSQVEKAQIGGRKAIYQRIQFHVEGGIAHADRVYIDDPKYQLTFAFVYVDPVKAQAEKEIKRIVDSVVFR